MACTRPRLLYESPFTTTHALFTPDTRLKSTGHEPFCYPYAVQG